ncbi:MAG: DUF3343 domain-containing protein [Lachnospiraceae bacterium]|nr:DUF3343 domain-containing protein [Lachnospiraceae bacterium]
MFFSTSDVFEAEEKINDAGLKCKIVPTPVTDKAYCGVCVQTENQGALAVVEGMEFRIVD